MVILVFLGCEGRFFFFLKYIGFLVGERRVNFWKVICLLLVLGVMGVEYLGVFWVDVMLVELFRIVGIF